MPDSRAGKRSAIHAAEAGPWLGDAPGVTDAMKNTTLQQLTELFTVRMFGLGNASECAGAP